jgi:phosphoribosylanthranilate isomerase
LIPDNVQDGLRAVRPWGVDVASGVEQRPGVKDPARVAAFIRQVKEYDRHDSDN